MVVEELKIWIKRRTMCVGLGLLPSYAMIEFMVDVGGVVRWEWNECAVVRK